MYDIIIVGGGPAGLTAATYACRAGKTVLVIEKAAFGGQITWSPKVENFPTVVSISGTELGDRLLEQAMEQGAEVELEEVVSVEDRGSSKLVRCESGAEFEAKALIIATGAKPRMLGLEHEEELVGNGVGFCAVCDGAFYKGRDVAVNGGGNSALQDAMLLSETCRKVYLIHRRGSFRGEEKLVKALEAKDNVEFILDSTVEELLGDTELRGIAVRHPMSRITPFSPTSWSLTPRATPTPARIAAPGRPACLSRVTAAANLCASSPPPAPTVPSPPSPRAAISTPCDIRV